MSGATRTIFLVRGGLALLWAVGLFAIRDASWDTFFTVFVDYLILDGLLGFVIAGALIREASRTVRVREGMLGAATLVDSAGRLASGIAVHVWPGIPGFPVTAVLFLAVMATGTATIGLLEAGLTAREEFARRSPVHERPQFAAGPFALAAIASAAFGIASIVFIDRPDQMRLLIAAYVAAAGVSMFLIGRAHQQRHVAPPRTG